MGSVPMSFMSRKLMGLVPVLTSSPKSMDAASVPVSMVSTKCCPPLGLEIAISWLDAALTDGKNDAVGEEGGGEVEVDIDVEEVVVEVEVKAVAVDVHAEEDENKDEEYEGDAAAAGSAEVPPSTK